MFKLLYISMSGALSGGIAENEYRQVMEDICDFLAGRQERVVRSLKDQMARAAEGEEYEKAASFRNKLDALLLIGEKQKVTSPEKIDTDVIGFSRNEFDTAIQVLILRNGKLIEKRHFVFEDTIDDSDNELLSSFISQYYSIQSSIPANILLQATAEGNDTLGAWLSEKCGRKVNLHVPKRGSKLDIVRMAEKNALIELQHHTVRMERESYILQGLAELGVFAGLERAPVRIEAFDVSNIGASDTVAAMAVFRNGIPDKNNYRRYRIKSVEGQNDYAAMQEAVYRRFVGKTGNMPDLIFIDGGHGHVSAIRGVLAELALKVPVLGLVKDDRHRTRAIVGKGDNETVPSVKVLRLLTNIQDEAHRFAISYNKKLRELRYKASQLDNINGIGPKRKASLLRHFGSISAIRDAGIEGLIAAGGGMNISSAKKVYDYFHGNINRQL